MCGIAGYFSVTITEPGTLLDMTTAISHRGPDAAGYWEDNGVGLGHRRLSIIDLSESANQPMHSADGRYVIVFNGEVYNFRELKALHNIQTKTSSDTEVVLEMFAKYGVSCVSELNGMFALVIYDKKERKFYIFRDRVGKKPLFYCLINGTFYFSSEIKSFYAIGLKKHFSIRNESISEFLHLGYIPQPHSIFNEVMKFPSGCWGLFDGKSLDIESYWKLNNALNKAVLTDERKAKLQLKELLHSSIEYRMISDVPMGTFLSGGIDSSLVTAIASKISTSKLNTFSIGFNESKHDESRYAETVAKHLGTNHHKFTVNEQDALALVDEITKVYDEPFSDSSALPTLLVSKLARQNVTMTLSGDGGDELFLGYGAYHWAERLSKPFIKTFKKPIAFTLKLGNNRMKRAAEVFDFETSQDVHSHVFSQEQYLFSQKEIQSVVRNPVSYHLNLDLKEVKRTLSAKEQQAVFDTNFYLKDDLLVKVDRASMRFSLETRCPLLDFRLVEFAFSLHEDLRMNKGVQKYLLKEVLFDYVPREMFNRPKWGFSIPLNKWMKNDLAFLFDKYLSKAAIEHAGILNYSEVNTLQKRYFAGEDYLYNRLWVLILLQKFLL